MKQIAEKCARLTALKLYHSSLIRHNSDAEKAIALFTENCTKLTKIENGNEMSTTSLNSIANKCKNFTSINLPIENEFSYTTLDLITKECKQLKEINMWGVSFKRPIRRFNHTNHVFENLTLKNITNLGINRLELTDEMIDTISNKCSSLTTLEIDNVELGDYPNNSLGKINSKTLTSLTICGIGDKDDGIYMDEGISAISSKCVLLKKLSIGFMLINGDMLKDVAKNTKLTTLSLQNLIISQDKLVSFVNECTTLSNLNIFDTDKQYEVIAEITKHNKICGTTKIVYTTRAHTGIYNEYI
jgi:hypothetical protein